MTDIKGYEGLYAVTTDGRIYSYCFKNNGSRGHCGHNGMYLKPYLVRGYKTVDLRKNTSRKTFKVHRLVANAFIDNPLNKPTVNHIDGNKLNNNVSNLEWNTYSENTSHAYSLGLNRGNKGKKFNTSDEIKKKKRYNQRIMASNNRKLSLEDASDICEAYNTGIFTQNEIALHFNVSRRTIGNIINGVSYGF